MSKNQKACFSILCPFWGGIVYTEGLISQAYVYPHKQSLFTIDNFSSFLTQNRTLTALYTFLLLSGPPSDYIEDVELWLSTALIFNNRPSITSPHKQAFHGRGVFDISPPWRWLYNLAPYTHPGLGFRLRRLSTPSQHDFGHRPTGLTSGPLAWARRIVTPSENDFALRPTAWELLAPALYIRPTTSLFKSD